MLVRLGVFMMWLLHFLPFRVLVWLGNGLGLLFHAFGKDTLLLPNVEKLQPSICGCVSLT